MRLPKFLLTVGLLLQLTGIPCVAVAGFQPDMLELHDLQRNTSGVFEKIGGDPYIIFPEIEQQICSSKGVLFSIRFEKQLTKPLLLEVFWSTETLGFGEENKVFFTAYPQTSGNANRFIVPLDHIATFSQIRIDFPSYLDTNFTLEEYEIVSLDNPPDEVEIVSAFRILTMDEALNPHILVPYLQKSLKHGLQRFTQDKLFFFSWILLLMVLLYAIRRFSSWTSSET